MKDHDGCRRAFVWSARAWYHRPGDRPEINFGMYADEGGTSGEMTMEWIELNGRQVPRLRAFDDSWSALATFGDLLQNLGQVDDENITQKQFVEMLLSCGFEDQTKYESPYEPKETALRKELAELEAKAEAIRQRLT